MQEPADNYHDSKIIPGIIDQNCKKFAGYNAGRIRMLINSLSEKKRELFKILPFLLHVNKAEFPGFIDHPLRSFGIFNFADSDFWHAGLEHFRADEKKIQPYLSPKYHIRGVYLMGSAGTFAQSEVSDFDYWIVVDPKTTSPIQLAQLTRKLSRLRRWAMEQYSHDTSFFILNINDLRINNFCSALGEESSGSTQKTILKEEFYRTIVMIAGQIPFWTVLPPGLGQGKYQRWVTASLESDRTDNTRNSCLDIGNLTRINLEECEEAILWNIFKSRKAPVKSLIKTSLIASFNFSIDEKPLPCERLKKNVLESICIKDPYHIIFEDVMTFAEDIDNKELLETLRDCIFLRLAGYPNVAAIKKRGGRKELLLSYPEKWGWDKEKLDSLKKYNLWPEREKKQFDEKILKQIAFLYELVCKSNDPSKPDRTASRLDVEELKNRISQFYQKKPGKIPWGSAWLRSKNRFKAITIMHEPHGQELDIWTAWHPSGTPPADKAGLLFTGPEMLRVAGWLTLNGLPDCKRFSLNFKMPRPFDAGILEQLFNSVHNFFKGGSDLITLEPRWVKMMIVLHPDSQDKNDSFIRADYLIKNTWNELYFDLMDFTHIENNSIKCYKTAEKIWNYMRHTQKGDFKYKILFLGNEKSQNLGKTIENFIEDFKEKLPDMDEVKKTTANNHDDYKPILDLL